MKTIDADLQKYFTSFFLTHFNIDAHYTLIKPKRTCIFTILVNNKMEEFHINYQEDMIDEYSLFFKTTADSSFLTDFCNILFDVPAIDYDTRFNNIIKSLEDINIKFKIFKKINLLNSGLYEIKSIADKRTGVFYNELIAKRHIFMSNNSFLYINHKKSHYLTSCLYFVFKKNVLESTCYLYSHSISNNKMDHLDMLISGSDKSFAIQLKGFQKKMQIFSYNELFVYITKEMGITMENLMLMTEEELKPYADVITMVRI